jgi:hypothetical protein
VYIGASLGQSDVSINSHSNLNLPGFDGKDTAYKIIAGLRPLDWLGVEVNYVDLGKPDDNSVRIGTTTTSLEARTNGVSGFVVGFAAVGPVDIFAKAGMINWDATISTRGARLTKSDGTDLAYGVGAQFRLLSLAFRAEYERFELEDRANMLSIGATWTFL